MLLSAEQQLFICMRFVRDPSIAFTSIMQTARMKQEKGKKYYPHIFHPFGEKFQTEMLYIWRQFVHSRTFYAELWNLI